MNKNIKFLRYGFYQHALKIKKKNYFLLDFFYGLKGFFLYKKKKLKRKTSFICIKSFNTFINKYTFNNKFKFDYFCDSLLNYSALKSVIYTSYKKKKIFLFHLQ